MRATAVRGAATRGVARISRARTTVCQVRGLQRQWLCLEQALEGGDAAIVRARPAL
jgi:hypothetical protein